MNDIDAYLNEVCWAMGGSFAAQQAARDELRAHIRDAARELEFDGMTAEEALHRAIADLGAAEDVGRGLRASRGTAALRRPLVQPLGALILERAHVRRLPAAQIGLALAALLVMSAAIAGVYLWPA